MDDTVLCKQPEEEEPLNKRRRLRRKGPAKAFAVTTHVGMATAVKSPGAPPRNTLLCSPVALKLQSLRGQHVPQKNRASIKQFV